jgi:glycosyltransferase involved in cell wall biosynthesis
MTEKISVVMATYNGDLYLREQLDSIINQTYPIYELIIQDDCSSDNTWKIINEYAIKYPNLIRKYQTIKNLGPHNNFKSAFQFATGEYIAPSDQDDIWSLDKIDILQTLIKDNDLSFSQEKILFEDGDEQVAFETMKPIENLMWKNNLKGHTFLFKRSLLIDYLNSGNLSFDYVLVLCACMRNSFISTNQELSIWRRHSKVCTFAVLKNSSFKIEQISSWKKMWVSMWNLLKGEKSFAINQSFNDRSNLIGYIAEGDKKLKNISKLSTKISEQSFLSYIQAGLINIFLLKYDKTFSIMSLRNKIGAILFTFRTPYVYWFDMHNEKSLE